MVMDSLYHDTCPCCGGRGLKNSTSATFRFTPEVMARILTAIYEGTYNVEKELIPELYELTRDTFAEALQTGWNEGQTPDTEDDFYTLLRNDAYVFAAFRTHREQNDIAMQLLDEDGKLKDFRTFQRDVENIIGTYNNAWLQTEYDTAILRAHQAADWRRFLRNEDIFPNLRWMPTTSAAPDPAHKEYWSIRLTLPKTHRFWQSHRPGDRWNCKCSLEETDDPATGDAAIPMTRYKQSPGLDNNPGADGHLFSRTHPYYTEAYPGARDAVQQVLPFDLDV